MTQPPWGQPPPPRPGAGPSWAPQSWPSSSGPGLRAAAPPWQMRPGQQNAAQYAGRRFAAQQWPQQHWPAPPPQRPRRSGLGNAVRVVLAVVAVLLVASWVRGMMDAAAPARPPAQVPQQPADPNSPYKNEGYIPPPVDMKPPAVPGPRDLEAARLLVRENALYDQSVPTPTNCQMDELAVTEASAAKKQEHFNQLMGCLMTVWAGPVEAAGFQLPRPSVTVYQSTIRTRCGDAANYNASYCAGDQRIYYSDNLLDALPRHVATNRYAAEMILAHEFGHAVQARTAMLVSNSYLEEAAATEERSKESSRRLEVQADCFAGQFVRSVARSQGLSADDLTGLRALTHNLGDDVVTGRKGYAGGHGTSTARTNWFDRGLGSDAIATCNTFTVDAEEVR